MNANQRFLERIAIALECIANALGKLPPDTAPARKDAVQPTPEKTKSITAKKEPQKLPVEQGEKPTEPETVAKKPTMPLSKMAKKKMAELRKTPAGQQLCDFLETLGLTILNPGAIVPKVERPKLAKAIWQFRSVAFELMSNINYAIHRKAAHTIDLAGKTDAERANLFSICIATKKAKLITYEKIDDQIVVTPLEDKTNYICGRWGEDIILSQTLKIADFLNMQRGKPICSVFKNIEYKKNGSDRWMDSECDIVLIVNKKFYFIEVKTGKQLSLTNYVTQVEHLKSKKEFSIFCCLDAKAAPEVLQQLREKGNFEIFDFEHFEDSLKKLIKKRQSYSFDQPQPVPPTLASISKTEIDLDDDLPF